MFGKLKTFTGLKKPKQTVLLCREPLLDRFKPLFPHTKNAPCRTTRPSCVSFYSETSPCAGALPLLMDLNAVRIAERCWDTLNLAAHLNRVLAHTSSLPDG